MFHFPGFPTYTYVFSIRYTVLRRVCSHIRKSADITLICSSPQLIAACHVLHRLLMPRHSPYALLCLNFRSRPSRGARCSLELLESYKRFRFHITRIKRFSFSLLSVRFNTLFRAFFLLLYSVFNEQFRTFSASRTVGPDA